MKRIQLSLILIFTFISAYPQKPALDTAVLDKWGRTYRVSGDISNDGRYVVYGETEGESYTSYLQSLTDAYKLELPDGVDGSFTQDSKFFFAKLPGDSLYRLDLGTRKASYHPDVRSYQVPEGGDCRWICYMLTTGETVLENLRDGTKQTFNNVKSIQFSGMSKVLLLLGAESSGEKWLKWVDLEKGNTMTVYHGEEARHLVFDQAEDRLTFFTTAGKWPNQHTQLWLYETGMNNAKMVVSRQNQDIAPAYEPEDGSLEFSPDGQKLFFTLKQVQPAHPPSKTGVSVNIWNYKDEYLQCDQQAKPMLDHLEAFRAVYNTLTSKVLRLEGERDGLSGSEQLNHGQNDNYFLTGTKYNINERFFRPQEHANFYLINTNDGTRITVSNAGASFSPGGKYVWWYDHEKHAYYVYDIKHKIRRNVSHNIPVSLTDEFRDDVHPSPYGIAGWLKDDSVVLIYDRYDIWKVDPASIRPPQNLTNGYGRRHQIVLRCSYNGKDLLTNDQGDLILCALDKDKRNGFFSVNLRDRKDPVELSMNNALLYFPTARFVPGPGGLDEEPPRELQRSGSGDHYLLRKQSAAEYPNLVVTDDFRTFKQLTDVEPQKPYNWMSSELVRWKTFAGHSGEGILYKPENFDSQKKYPVIFHYYEHATDGLNHYWFPKYATGNMDIPWFVSHGYLVFCPEMHYKIGDLEASVYDVVVSAAKMMSQKSWVDGKRMGIQGHSFGGYETNLLVTQTNLFAAASEGAGPTDLISMSGEAGLAACSGQPFTEYAQFRMGAPLWQDRDGYIRNSPVFQADRVTTPLLMMQNKKDSTVPWGQGVEFFTALRRLNKPCWMLQYDNGGHNVGGKDAVDYTIRLTQFFDHYLKGAPEPVWMSRGIPYRLKGIDDGLEMPDDKAGK